MNYRKFLKITSILLTVSLVSAVTSCSVKFKDADNTEETTAQTTAENTTEEVIETESSSESSETDISVTPTGESFDDTLSLEKLNNIKCGTISEGIMEPTYIVAKDENGQWFELTNGTGITYLDEADNKVYYSDGYTIKYIDINDPELKENTLFEFNKWYNEEYGYEEVSCVYDAVVIGNTMYFNFNAFGGGDDPSCTTDGLMKIELNASSIDEAEQLIPVCDLGSWEYSEKENAFYYRDGSERSIYETLYRYDLSTGESTKIMESVNSFEIEDDQMLLLTEGGLKLMDLNTGDIQIVSPDSYSPRTGTLWSYAELENGDVYFSQGQNIVRYNNGNNILVCEVASSNFYGFECVENDIIRIIYDDYSEKYYVNGEYLEDLHGIADVQVRLKDGTTKDFTLGNFIW